MKSVKNFRYVEKTSAECNEDSYLAILHLSRVELHCKLQEKLHRVTWPLRLNTFCSSEKCVTCFAMCSGVIFFALNYGRIYLIVNNQSVQPRPRPSIFIIF